MNDRNRWGSLRGQRLSRRSFLRAASVASVGAAGIALVGCGDDDDGEGGLGTADVLGIWGSGDELARFEAMVAPWELATGGRMAFTGTP